MIMNRYNQTGGLNAFLRVFSCAGNGCGDDAGRRGRAGWRSRGRGGGGMGGDGACGGGYGAVVCAVKSMFRGGLR